MSLYMGDITDLFSTVARTRVSPQKSYVASYTTTGSAADTGATLSVANGQSYAICFSVNVVGSGNFIWTLMENGVTKQTVTQAVSAGTLLYFSNIYTNVTGATQTVKLQASASSSAIGSTVNTIQLISGTFVIPIYQSSVTVPISAYVTTLEMVGASVSDITKPVSVLTLLQSPTSTTSTSTILNLFVNGFNCSAQGQTSASLFYISYVAFDFDGKTLVI